MRDVEPAGFWIRTLATIIDEVVLFALTAPLMWLAYGEWVAKTYDLRPWSMAINWLFPLLATVACWTLWCATPGKLLVGVRIVDLRSGASPSPIQCVIRCAAYLVSLVPLGFGFLWVAIDPDKQAWHDKIAGTRAVRTRRVERATDWRGRATDDAPRPGFVVSHWRGELSLPVSFWVNNLLLPIPLTLALVGMTTWIGLKGEFLRANSIAALVGWPLILALDAWCIVGAWRSASAYRDGGGSTFWALATQAVLVLSAIGTASSTYLNFVPQFGTYVQLARGVDPLGQVDATVSVDGRRLKLKGPVGMGDATRVEEIAARSSALKVVELESPGGRIHEANRIADLVRSRAWQTRATGDCDSACTLIFMAGAQRRVTAGAQLGFHRANAITYNPVVDEIANQQMAALYRTSGLPEDFIQRMLGTPAWSIWHPSRDELVAAGLVKARTHSLDIELPTAGPAQPTEILDELRSNEAWIALDRRFPGSMEEAAARMVAASVGGASADEILVEGRSVAEALLPRLVLAATSLAKAEFISIVSAQLKAARASGINACRAILAGDVTERHKLPRELGVRETNWMLEAARGSIDPAANRSPSPLELEVVRHSLGDKAPALLVSLWGPAGAGARHRDCDRTIAVFDEVTELPVAQRGLAIRLIFQQP